MDRASARSTATRAAFCVGSCVLRGCLLVRGSQYPLCCRKLDFARKGALCRSPPAPLKGPAFFFCMQPLLQNPACCCQGLNPRSYVLWRCWWFLTHELHSPLRTGEPLVPVNPGRGGRTEQCLPSCGRRVLKERFIRHTSADQNGFRYCHAN